LAASSFVSVSPSLRPYLSLPFLAMRASLLSLSAATAAVLALVRPAAAQASYQLVQAYQGQNFFDVHTSLLQSEASLIRLAFSGLEFLWGLRTWLSSVWVLNNSSDAAAVQDNLTQGVRGFLVFPVSTTRIVAYLHHRTCHLSTRRSARKLV
jgi:ABC-type sugar transport system substrate-binding protein